MTKSLISKIIIDSPDCDISKQKWIPFKDIYVTVSKTQYDMTYELLAPEEQGHFVVCCTMHSKG